ncbi:hypothetical protein B0F89_10758 [Malaciobacter marinus]|jgi:uncharacterized membrane-anchored protein YhcB (DUF1043 family)|uniref:ATP-binding protein n=1 Tax=Malaciobacter marinus TaxID=505249 RepID=A0AB36ZZY7_9BACT|nr:hypothetical protein [Malaciobacter marinus]PPK61822.1 hypothetical protein B0F89_10758 [Malaciobacter marinus]
MIQTIFLKENEKNIFGSLQNQGIDTSKFEKHFIDLFNKIYNNEVGYYIFEQDEQIYKIIILPKTIDEKSSTAQKEFVDYLLHYHRVNNKYKFDKTKQIPNSLLSLAFEGNNQDKNNSHNPIEEFEYYKYKSILESIEAFFKRHKNYKKVHIDYKSQDIKYKLNLSKNIKELDKTKIHQTQSIEMMYSQIATITNGALKLFAKRRIDIIKDAEYKKLLVQETKKVISFIAKKYPIDKSYKFSLSKLNNSKTTKLYSKKSDTKLLLVDIKSLFGFEQMYEDNNLYVNNRYDLTTTSFFIDPILFYEWYVYDILKDFAEDKKYKILFDKDEDNKTTIKYELVSQKFEKDKDRSSNPDYILIDEEKNIKVVLDAKWKNIEKLGDIKSSDFLKLKHDASLLENSHKTIPYLIYPNYLSDEDKISISKDDNQAFNFGSLQIDMDFNKESNSINFRYDFEKIEKQLKKESQEKKVQKILEDFKSQLDDKRTELITKLLNSEDLEDKEDLFNNLDNQLLESSKLLSNQLIGEKLPNEIEQILKDYDETLSDISKDFLKSSGLIYNYYKKKNYKYFDYSMPASGLWKLVERELNTSFVWYVRIQKRVCDSTCPWTSLFTRKDKITHEIEKGKTVKLNQFHYSKDELQGVMLGGINLLLKDNDILNYFNTFINIDDYITSDIIKNISTIRNENAHIKAMNLEKFEELYKLLFKDGNINKLLEMKGIIRNKIESL